MSRGPGFIAGLIIGAVAGAAAGLLLAPKPGEQMRRQLLEGSGEWGTRLEDAATFARAAAETAVEAGKNVVEEQRSRFQEAIRESQEAAAETSAKLMSDLEKAQHGGHGRD